MVFGPDGGVLATYRKIHLFGFDTGEAVTLSAGSDIVTVQTPLGTTGLATCYDLRFPEMFRALTDVGATAVLIPTGWPEARIGHWDLLTAARATGDAAAIARAEQQLDEARRLKQTALLAGLGTAAEVGAAHTSGEASNALGYASSGLDLTADLKNKDYLGAAASAASG